MLAYRISANPPHIELREVEDPVPSPDETLVRVRAFSLNRGEVVDLARGTEGEAVGWDVASVAETGERVVGVVGAARGRSSSPCLRRSWPSFRTASPMPRRQCSRRPA